MHHIHPPATHADAKMTSISEMCEMCCQIKVAMACVLHAQPKDLCSVKSWADKKGMVSALQTVLQTGCLKVGGDRQKMMGVEV